MQWDSFSTGQIGSKLWLADKLHHVLELHSVQTPLSGHRIEILAGWYAVTNLLLRTKGQIPIAHVRSWDMDPSCEELALKVNKYWHWLGQFTAVTHDVNNIDWWAVGQQPSIIINTSVEHIESREWFDRIPEGTFVVLQGNDMPHDDHVASYPSQEAFAAAWPLKELLYTGTKHFAYPDWAFNRYMIMGIK
jgi:hypothetical protein